MAIFYKKHGLSQHTGEQRGNDCTFTHTVAYSEAKQTGL